MKKKSIAFILIGFYCDYDDPDFEKCRKALSEQTTH